MLNRLRPPSDGDILVPYQGTSILGTTATIIEDPDNFTISDEDVKMLIKEGSQLVPELSKTRVIRTYASVRPLMRTSEDGRKASRDFTILDHERENGVSGLISIIGGKFTTSRLVGERVGDLVSEKLGVREKSKTKEIKLISPNEMNFEKYLEKIGIPKIFLRSIMERKGSLDEERYETALYLLLSLIARGK